MSTRIFDRLKGCGAALALLALGGCIEAGLVGQAPNSIRVAGGNVLVTGPTGYCIDRGATRNGLNQAFVVMARCDALGGQGGSPAAPTLLTVSVAKKTPDDPNALPAAPLLRRFARTEAGRAALATDGNAASIDIVDTRVRTDIFFVHARDLKTASPALSADNWRAIFEVKGYLISARVNAFAARPISSDTGFATLNALAARIKADNAVSEVETIPAVAGPETTRDARRPGPTLRIFP